MRQYLVAKGIAKTNWASATTWRLGKHPALTALVFASGAAAFAALALRWRLSPTGNSAVPEPTKPVDLDQYLGRWHELGRYENRFERNCEGVIAEYNKRESALIDILNTCHICEPGGRRRVARGRARIVEGSGNAKLKVSFFGPFFFGNYWVLDHADDYSWSIVGEPSGRYLWVLSRDPLPSDGFYEQLVERCHSLGYDMTRFRRTRHLTP